MIRRLTARRVGCIDVTGEEEGIGLSLRTLSLTLARAGQMPLVGRSHSFVIGVGDKKTDAHQPMVRFSWCFDVGVLWILCDVVQEVAKTGRLPVVNFAAGGIATPADAALMMQLGVDGAFLEQDGLGEVFVVGENIF